MLRGGVERLSCDTAPLIMGDTRLVSGAEKTERGYLRCSSCQICTAVCPVLPAFERFEQTPTQGKCPQGLSSSVSSISSTTRTFVHAHHLRAHSNERCRPMGNEEVSCHARALTCTVCLTRFRRPVVPSKLLPFN